jgi:hypothetical protein
MPEGPAFFQTIKRLTTVKWGGTLGIIAFSVLVSGGEILPPSEG